MPRDGSNIYSLPFPDVVTLTTIESAKYNGTLNDIKTDLNTPRPIVAGGTGATTAPAALTALSGEIASAGQIVTNYGTQVFIAGSFQSAANATGAPNTTDRFVGTALVYGANDISLEALSLEAGKLWTRKKTAGVWGAWVDAGVGPYVPIPGGTMTGPLIINTTNAGALVVGPNGTTNPVLKIDDSGASAASGIVVTGRAAATGVAIDATSSGTNENIVVRGKGAGGVQLGSTGGATGLVITGLAAGSGVTVDAVSTGADESILVRPKGTGGVTITSPSASAFAVGPNGTTNPALRIDDSLASAATGLLLTPCPSGSGVYLDITSPGTTEPLFIRTKGSDSGVRFSTLGLDQQLYIGQPTSLGPGTIIHAANVSFSTNQVIELKGNPIFVGPNYRIDFGALVSGGAVFSCMANYTGPGGGYIGIHNTDTSGASQGNQWFFRNGVQVGSIGTNSTATYYATSSDARLKTDEQPLTNAGTILGRLKIWDFQWIKSGERDVGVFAQEAAPEFPHAIIPPQNPDDPWMVDYAKYVPLLIQDAQDTHTRLTALEAQVADLQAAVAALQAKP